MPLSQASLTKLNVLHPDLIRLVNLAWEKSKVKFEIVQGRRTMAKQLEYFLAGKSRIDPRKSPGRHQVDCAVDVIAIDPKTGKLSYETKTGFFDRIYDGFYIASQQLKIPMRWGGTFKTLKDYGHFELPKSSVPDDWRKRKAA